MNDLETTCLDYIMESGIRGMEECIIKQHYLENGVSEEKIENAERLLNAAENKK